MKIPPTAAAPISAAKPVVPQSESASSKARAVINLLAGNTWLGAEPKIEDSNIANYLRVSCGLPVPADTSTSVDMTLANRLTAAAPTAAGAMVRHFMVTCCPLEDCFLEGGKFNEPALNIFLHSYLANPEEIQQASTAIRNTSVASERWSLRANDEASGRMTIHDGIREVTVNVLPPDGKLSISGAKLTAIPRAVFAKHVVSLLPGHDKATLALVSRQFRDTLKPILAADKTERTQWLVNFVRHKGNMGSSVAGWCLWDQRLSPADLSVAMNVGEQADHALYGTMWSPDRITDPIQQVWSRLSNSPGANTSPSKEKLALALNHKSFDVNARFTVRKNDTEVTTSIFEQALQKRNLPVLQQLLGRKDLNIAISSNTAASLIQKIILEAPPKKDWKETIEVLDVLWKSGRFSAADLNAACAANGDTALHSAIRSGFTDAARWLRNHGADDSIRNIAGQTASALSSRSLMSMFFSP